MKTVKEESMKTMVLRLATFFVVAVFAVAVTAQDEVYNLDFGIGGGVAGSCSTCYMNAGGSHISMYCGSAEPGGWGHQNCRIESYPEGSYCLVDGSECCVD
jgi:hypothetical protein